MHPPEDAPQRGDRKDLILLPVRNLLSFLGMARCSTRRARRRAPIAVAVLLTLAGVVGLAAGEPATGAPVDHGSIELRVVPANARVHLDGVNVGQAREFDSADEALLVTPRPHQIELTRRGYMKLRLVVPVKAGQHHVVEQWLREGDGLDPRSTTIGKRPHVASPATADAEAAGDGAASVITDERGLVRIEVLPADATVQIDGKFVARADELSRLHGALPLTLGRHLVEVLRPGYRSERVEISVQRDAVLELKFDLESALDSP